VSRARNRQRRYEAAIARQTAMHAVRPDVYAPPSAVLRRNDAGPLCSCTVDTDRQINSDGCPRHDLIVCGPFMGGCR
jgi:hypothetical protein